MSFISMGVPTVETTTVQKKTNLSVKVDMDVKSELQRMAKARDRSVHYIMLQALDEYIAKEKAEEEAKEMFYQRAEDSFLHMRETGLHATHEEVTDWLQSLKTDTPKPMPQCHT